MQGFDFGGLSSGWLSTTHVGPRGMVHPREYRREWVEDKVPTRDIPFDILPPEGIAAVKRKVDWSIFMQRNELKFQKEMNLLLPPEYQEWDPTRMDLHVFSS